MSTLMWASASGPKIAAETPGPVRQPPQGNLRLVLGVGNAGNDFLFHDFFLVANESSGRVEQIAHSWGVRIFETGAHEGPDLVHHGQLDRPDLQHLGSERCHFQHLLEGDLLHPPCLGLDPRIRGVDTIDIGVDVAPVCPHRGGNRHCAGV
jgi:hypothetical protein